MNRSDGAKLASAKREKKVRAIALLTLIVVLAACGDAALPPQPAAASRVDNDLVRVAIAGGGYDTNIHYVRPSRIVADNDMRTIEDYEYFFWKTERRIDKQRETLEVDCRSRQYRITARGLFSDIRNAEPDRFVPSDHMRSIGDFDWREAGPRSYFARIIQLGCEAPGARTDWPRVSEADLNADAERHIMSAVAESDRTLSTMSSGDW